MATAYTINLLNEARSQLGTLEAKDHSSKYGTWYSSSFKKEPWCCMFVSWCSNKGGLTAMIPKYAACALLATYYKKKNLWFGKNIVPGPGWLVFYDFQGIGIHHIGIVEATKPDGRIITIEGNTDDPNGRIKLNGVFRKTRSLSNVVGYAAPNGRR